MPSEARGPLVLAVQGANRNRCQGSSTARHCISTTWTPQASREGRYACIES